MWKRRWNIQFYEATISLCRNKIGIVRGGNDEEKASTVGSLLVCQFSKRCEMIFSVALGEHVVCPVRW